LIVLIAITALHYENVSRSALLHEISQRLYYLTIIYAAYRYGLRGGLTASLVSNVIGTSAAMRRVYALVEKVARADLAVLITGESGTF
jgi:transcriptional regulator with GAF, ATPase, and Fis domain